MDKPEYKTLIPLFDRLQGERVLIRPYQPDDAPQLQAAVAESREHIRPWLPFADEHQTIEASRDWIIQQQAKWLLREILQLSVWNVETNQFLGGTALTPRNWDIRYFEIGYWLRASAEGHGYMLETVKLLTDYALNELKANRVEIRCDERNRRSASVALRAGYFHEARLRNVALAADGTIRTTLIFSKIPGDS